MQTVAALVGLFLLLAVLWDAFETIVLPRRVSHRFGVTPLFYRFTWGFWSAIALRMRSDGRREDYLSFYGPLSLLLLLSVWAIGLVVGFALIQWAIGPAMIVQGRAATFATTLYMSGTTFFTLGLGDVAPISRAARAVTVAEAGTGFGFLALVIGYLPVLYQAFSRREVSISLLDARAGSPPSAVELLRRYGQPDNAEVLIQFLRDWERWSAELLESHLSYPVLGYYRSQHERQSWLAALTNVLDVCALLIAGGEGALKHTAWLTFAMARHTAVDLSQVFRTTPRMPTIDRMPPAALAQLHGVFATADVRLCERGTFDQKLSELREMYEPYVGALAEHLVMPLAPWLPEAAVVDDWQTSVWEHNGTAPLR